MTQPCLFLLNFSFKFQTSVFSQRSSAHTKQKWEFMRWNCSATEARKNIFWSKYVGFWCLYLSQNCISTE